ncbi:MAG: N-acetyl-gamma-glutamyl-phosphate reductase [Clostridia bacterium]|nr:MAG: N-acetyl-gamma-glutamyl-phosphate reductase [Clostridia bacterium]
MVRVSIIGATGYTGVELVRLLTRHPQVEVAALTSQSYAGRRLGEVYPHLAAALGETVLTDDVEAAVAGAGYVFLAMPHGQAAEPAALALAAGKRVIDLSADFRLPGETYAAWYAQAAPAPALLDQAVYGLAELYGPEVAGARLVANPGCYPTSALLALAPAVRASLVDIGSIIIDAKSGVSGSGRQPALGSLFCEADEGLHPYGVATHRHTPEIEAQLSRLAGTPVVVSFTPHLVPMTRGILSTIYAGLRGGVGEEEVSRVYMEFYQDKPFVRVLPPGTWPHTKWVYGSNYCLLGLTVDRRTNRLVLAAAIDNLVKGASGQAVQNFNLMAGFPEAAGLEGLGIFP